MVKNSLDLSSASSTAASPDVTIPPVQAPTNAPANYQRKEVLQKNHYFDNEEVERLLYLYLEGACTDVRLRDQIMSHAEELIRQIIKAHNLGQIYPGKEDSSIGDLFQIAWVQLESAIYKFECRPHCAICYNSLRPNDSLLIDEFIFADEIITKIKKCPYCKIKLTRDSLYYRGRSKVFNLFSQVARTVILAFIKKENRDRKNGPVFQTHLESRLGLKSYALERFLGEAREMCKFSDDHLKLLECIRQLYLDDDKPHEGLISKLVERSRLPRTTVTGFLRVLRLRNNEFTDSPLQDDAEKRPDRKDRNDSIDAD